MAAPMEVEDETSVWVYWMFFEAEIEGGGGERSRIETEAPCERR